METTRFGLRVLALTLVTLAATTVGAAQQQQAAAPASQPGSVLLDKFIGLFEGMAATGSAGFESLQTGLGELMQMARQSLADNRIDQPFFDRYTRILRVTVLSGFPDKSGILQPIITREVKGFIGDATGKTIDASGGISMQDLSAALETEINNLRKLTGSTPAASAAPTGPVRVGGTVKPPERTMYVDPVYPKTAMKAKVQGLVIVEATIGKDGRVIGAKVVKSVPLLDEAALEAVNQWEYTPTTIGGVPVEVLLIVTVSFKLK